MQIRKATAEEWLKVRDLYLTLLKTDPEAFVDEYEDIASQHAEMWMKELNNSNGNVFVAIDGERFVGMGRINLYKELPGIPVMHKLGVVPEFRGKGIAKGLVAVREEWARSLGIKKVRLYVIADRLETIKFSKKNGYIETELLKDNVKKNDGRLIDVLIMEKKF